MAAASLAILRLDTRFPRLPGDIACKDSFARPVRLQSIAEASVDAVVSRNPEGLDLSAFEQAVQTATEPLITTSCGFMIYFQDRLNALNNRPFISSALTALPALRARYRDEQIAILTFDADTLGAPAYAASLQGFSGPVVGLDKSGHLYRTIKEDHAQLDAEQAAAELAQLTRQLLATHGQVKSLLLECTNLSPYRAVFRAGFEGDIIDLLTILDSLSPGLVKPEFLI